MVDKILPKKITKNHQNHIRSASLSGDLFQDDLLDDLVEGLCGESHPENPGQSGKPGLARQDP